MLSVSIKSSETGEVIGLLIPLGSPAFLEENYLGLSPTTEIPCALSFIEDYSRHHDSVRAVKKQDVHNCVDYFLHKLQILPRAVFSQTVRKFPF